MLRIANVQKYIIVVFDFQMLVFNETRTYSRTLTSQVPFLFSSFIRQLANDNFKLSPSGTARLPVSAKIA